jgi:DNA (cytosine-5)-methyltransferase 1
MAVLTHGSLFSGIGGFDLAATWMGWENIFHCEWNTFGQRVLKHHFPKSISYNDITKTDFTIHRGKIDILTGGFPCQPYSLAGKRKGKDDERHLWPEMLRAIREIQPRWVVGENVFGLINWDGGLVFNEVQTDLEAEGYEVWPYVLPACAVNAPHRRDRVWFVAHAKSSGTWTDEPWLWGLPDGRGEWSEDAALTANPNDSGADQSMRDNGDWSQKNQGWEGQPQSELGQSRSNGASTDSESGRSGGLRDETETPRSCESSDVPRGGSGVPSESGITSYATSDGGREDNWVREPRLLNQTCESINWHDFPTQPPICSRDDGLPTELDGITFSKWRNESIKAAGNAIVPQVALQIFKSIKQYES